MCRDLVHIAIARELIVELMIQEECVAPVKSHQKSFIVRQIVAAVFITAVKPNRKPIIDLQNKVHLPAFLSGGKNRVHLSKGIAVHPVDIRRQPFFAHHLPLPKRHRIFRLPPPPRARAAEGRAASRSWAASWARLSRSPGTRPEKQKETKDLEIQGRSHRFDVIEVPDTLPNIVGQIPLEALDWVVDLRERKLIPNPEHKRGELSDEF